VRAIWITRHGGPEVLEVRETADPEPGPGQVRVRVHAAGLNFAEVMGRQGLYPDAPKPPCVLGYEAAGIVDALGPGVSGPSVGRQLLAALLEGSERAGIWTVQTGIFPENTASLALHHACGFRVVGVRERIGQLHGRWRDVLLLERRSPQVGR